ncbi:Threonine/homoserine/homoserine lactone efflux protein [Mesorhizobium albiziae]|uniref:Threonine/homoserine/homoserine lactone efflux protein n=1 Tax=Neomesorhizobium albiziae TaxID=335020 RepID=A0A1I3YNL5_9HYPH|nr:LysE family translocator [Mesorhizobium albiziae]GLS33419.1 lysine transporter LysE [Mesorhizobium albiziae]SFK32871.1 Threonine/homoserine/homoserine lactone efflux protein [Mesorhizobium albiziae]
MGSLFLAFLGVSIVVIVTPGPDTAITIRNTLLGGRAGGVFTALGIAAGQTVWAVATSAGMVAILVASEPLFLAVKYAGALYLVYLGIQALREAMAPSQAAAVGNGLVQPSFRLRPPVAFRQGLISDLGNPKMAVFFASLLPQFLPPGQASFSALLLLGVVFAAMTFAWLAFYAAVIAKAGDFLRRPAIRRAVEGVTGVLLIGLGMRIAAEQR